MLDDLQQALHGVWRKVLADPKVPAHEIVTEGMRRAYALGCEAGVREERDRSNSTPNR